MLPHRRHNKGTRAGLSPARRAPGLGPRQQQVARTTVGTRKRPEREEALGQSPAGKPASQTNPQVAEAQLPPSKHNASQPPCPLRLLGQQGLTGIWWQVGLEGKEWRSRLLSALGRRVCKRGLLGSPRAVLEKGEGSKEKTTIMIIRLGLSPNSQASRKF